VVQQTLEDDSVLFSNMVLAESYGIPYRVTGISNEDERKNIEKLEKYRIAVYHKKLKGIFNVNDWKFEEVTSYDPNKEVSDDEVKKLRKMVVKFLNIATATRIRGKQLDC
jgi:chaperonin GroEL (HSP60 family)